MARAVTHRCGEATIGDDDIAALLRRMRVVAIVGASPDPCRPSHEVMGFLQRRGVRCLPVNPRAAGDVILGETVFASLAELPAPVDLVDVFRNSREAGQAVDAAIAARQRLGLRAVWLQLGVRDDQATRRAEDAGLIAVQDRCLAIEISRLLDGSR
jgi:predicted CoA-binding protein